MEVLGPIINGDLLDLKLRPGEYIVHQTNCTSVRAAGLATHLFKRYPAANTYKASSSYIRKPGTISVHGPVINLYGQDTPGKAKSKANKLARIKWFTEGLEHISQLSDAIVVYFPYRIGCGMGGGDWEEYYDIITRWASAQSFEVRIVKHD